MTHYKVRHARKDIEPLEAELFLQGIPLGNLKKTFLELFWQRIAVCSGLQDINLANTRLTEVGDLSGLPHLESLDLRSNPLTTPLSLNAPQSLKTLFLPEGFDILPPAQEADPLVGGTWEALSTKPDDMIPLSPSQSIGTSTTRSAYSPEESFEERDDGYFSPSGPELAAFFPQDPEALGVVFSEEQLPFGKFLSHHSNAANPRFPLTARQAISLTPKEVTVLLRNLIREKLSQPRLFYSDIHGPANLVAGREPYPCIKALLKRDRPNPSQGEKEGLSSEPDDIALSSPRSVATASTRSAPSPKQGEDAFGDFRLNDFELTDLLPSQSAEALGVDGDFSEQLQPQEYDVFGEEEQNAGRSTPMAIEVSHEPTPSSSRTRTELPKALADFILQYSRRYNSQESTSVSPQP